MVINTYIIYESLEGLSCYNIIACVGVPVSLRHNGLSVVRIRGSLDTGCLSYWERVQYPAMKYVGLGGSHVHD
jgi:hypothetical protein